MTRMHRPCARSSFFWVSILSAGFLVVGCRSTATTQALETMSEHRYPLAQASRLVVSLPAAELIIDPSDGREIVVAAPSSFGVNLALDDKGDLEITAEISSPRNSHLPQMHISLPPGVPIEIDLENGFVDLRGLRTSIWVRTVAAGIQISEFSGTAWLQSQRGLIEADDSSGELHLIGEGRPIEITDCHGSLAATTIMGEITFSGRVDEGDTIRLESDHGGIQIQLDSESSSVFTLRSINGPIQCTLPGLMGTGVDCSASYGSGLGQVDVRTVTGPIRISSLE